MKYAIGRNIGRGFVLRCVLSLIQKIKCRAQLDSFVWFEAASEGFASWDVYLGTPSFCHLVF